MNARAAAMTSGAGGPVIGFYRLSKLHNRGCPVLALFARVGSDAADAFCFESRGVSRRPYGTRFRFSLACDAALKRRYPTNRSRQYVYHEPRPDNPVEERPFQGRVACSEEEAAFRPHVPFSRSAE